MQRATHTQRTPIARLAPPDNECASACAQSHRVCLCACACEHVGRPVFGTREAVCVRACVRAKVPRTLSSPMERMAAMESARMILGASAACSASRNCTRQRCSTSHATCDNAVRARLCPFNVGTPCGARYRCRLSGMCKPERGAMASPRAKPRATTRCAAAQLAAFVARHDARLKPLLPARVSARDGRVDGARDHLRIPPSPVGLRCILASPTPTEAFRECRRGNPASNRSFHAYSKIRGTPCTANGTWSRSARACLGGNHVCR